MPKTVDLSKPSPLVVAFHGMSIDSKDVMPLYTKLNEAAAKYETILAYPKSRLDGHRGLTPETVTCDLKFYELAGQGDSGQVRDRREPDVRRRHVDGWLLCPPHRTAARLNTVAAWSWCHLTLGLQTILGIHAKRKFPVMIIHGDKDRIIKVETARENRDKYKREGHEVVYLELPGEGHMWGKNVNPELFEFFAEHPLKADKSAAGH